MTAPTMPDMVQQTIRRRNRITFWVTLALLAVTWYFVRPGVFTIQPIGALPDGITFVYHSRGPQLPLFASPDSLCLKAQDSVNLLCRAAAIGAAGDLTDRIIVRLPYIRWAYLLSTGGREFVQ